MNAVLNEPKKNYKLFFEFFNQHGPLRDIHNITYKLSL